MNTTYKTSGYCIVRQAIKPDSITLLQQLIKPVEKRKRKVILLGQPEIVQAINDLVRPIYQSIQVETGRLEELYLLVAHASHPVKLGWHKDAKMGDGIHSFQLPLLPGDNIHEVVPKTHLRDINEAERIARNAGGNEMPNAVRVDLAVGDILLRSPFLYHRGYSLQGIERLTFVGTYADG